MCTLVNILVYIGLNWHVLVAGPFSLMNLCTGGWQLDDNPQFLFRLMKDRWYSKAVQTVIPTSFQM